MTVSLDDAVSRSQGLTWEKAISGFEARCPTQNRRHETKNLFPFSEISLTNLTNSARHEQWSYCWSGLYRDFVFAKSESFSRGAVPWVPATSFIPVRRNFFDILLMLVWRCSS